MELLLLGDRVYIIKKVYAQSCLNKYLSLRRPDLIVVQNAQ